MTLKKLSRYYELRKRLMLYEDTLGSLRAAAESITPRLSDMPRSPNTQDKLSKFAASIVDLEQQIEKLKVQVDTELQVVTAYVEAIEDGYLRTIYRLRFVECMTWTEVATAVGGNNTEDSVKKICYRFLETTE